MLNREIIDVSSEIHTKHINTAVWTECRIFNICHSKMFNTYINIH